ncbi:hypothetical protein [Neptuniibacter sp. CAU 1671]|uniref:hypothetical protein n=1 Tax=Neptuniibacter sp. CAU 1671 TaxID=3032593 RepID=UPI0023DC4D21|nr:hypothetical protein [Neptuniibacter sp. CAU 1671]MDF2182926.1 hypothetical protein [Neptuniibacter sp. CAU 1671]
MTQNNDRHNLQRISRWVALVFSALIAALGVAGYQRTGDLIQLAVFLGISLLGYFVVLLLFYGIGRLLDSLDDSQDSSR